MIKQQKKKKQKKGKKCEMRQSCKRIHRIKIFFVSQNYQKNKKVYLLVSGAWQDYLVWWNYELLIVTVELFVNEKHTLASFEYKNQSKGSANKYPWGYVHCNPTVS